jgi:hypothetical protein
MSLCDKDMTDPQGSVNGFDWRFVSQKVHISVTELTLTSPILSALLIRRIDIMCNRRILFVVAAVVGLAGCASRSNPVSVADTDCAGVALSKAGDFVIIE